MFVPANFGIMGGARYDLWDPIMVPPSDHDPHLPQSNRATPMAWNTQVADVARMQAIQQAGLTQLSAMVPATFVSPGTASVVAF